jgi:ribosome-associated protein
MATTEQRERTLKLVEAALDRKAQKLVALDVAGLSAFTDTFVIATGTSDRHVRAVADAVVEASKAMGQTPLGVEGYQEGHWVLIDLNDVVVHVFRADMREHYDLDRLWEDAPVIPSPVTAPEKREELG